MKIESLSPYRTKVTALYRFKSRIDALVELVAADLENCEKTFLLGQFARAESYAASAESAANQARHLSAELRTVLTNNQTS